MSLFGSLFSQGSGSSLTLSSTPKSGTDAAFGFDNSGFTVNQGASDTLVYVAIGVAALALFFVVRRR